MSQKKNRLYFDYAATTPLDSRVFRKMQPYFSRAFGNPGSLHSFGQEAIKAVDFSRETIAYSLAVQFREIIFTSSATEANNLGLQGAFDLSKPHPGRLIISSIEHESVLETARYLESRGVEVVRLPVDAFGRVNLLALERALTPHTRLVSLILTNNEIGTIQDFSSISRLIREYRKERQAPWPLLHTDAAQAFPYTSTKPQDLGVDLLTLSSHKIYGPKGAALLWVKGLEGQRSQPLLSPLLYGGGQEFGLRSSTENVPALVGFGEAVSLADQLREKEVARLRILREKAFSGIRTIFPNLEINGHESFREGEVSPHILNIFIPHIHGEDLVTALDLQGVAVSMGSACHSRRALPSHVVEALGHSPHRVRGSLRLSFGRATTLRQISELISRIKKVSSRFL